MDINNMATLTIPNYTYYGQVIPINKLTLIAALAGTGKSYTTIKFFNTLSIVPIYCNLDYTPIGDLVAQQYDETLLHHAFITKDLTGMSGRVLVIDTYVRYAEYISQYISLKGKELEAYNKATKLGNVLR